MDKFMGISLAIENSFHQTFQQLFATATDRGSSQLLKRSVI